MKLGKNFKIILVVFVIAITGAIATSQSASAKTKWTKGVPTALQGKWRSKTNYTGPTAFGDTETIQQYFIGGKSDLTVIVRQTGNPLWTNKAAYHHVKGSKYYYVKSTADAVIYYKVQLSGKKLRFKTYLTLNKKGKATKMQLGTIKSYSNWLYKGQARNKYALGAL
ncbi:hypothetical protein IWT5_00815 [Secundilactobacillus silagincola]|uniref:DUF5640 domain-containing protein n=1 Tax=Secundilactobacillus silagincola TaxID=1714681 RepID=A0A1Z5J0U5_9LACO|nr:hypothetical protein [Secundilactobacillus silagincola]GAX07665.1 hypothetical protein IWT5_00815 [Secundilactobacillus silagincola]